MTITIDVGSTKMVVYPEWGTVVFLFPNREPCMLTLKEAIGVMEDIKAGR